MPAQIIAFKSTAWLVECNFRDKCLGKKKNRQLPSNEELERSKIERIVEYSTGLLAVIPSSR